MEQDSPSQRFFIVQKLHSEGQILVFCKGLKMQILSFQEHPDSYWESESFALKPKNAKPPIQEVLRL